MKGNKFKLVVIVTILGAMLVLYYYSLSSDKVSKEKEKASKLLNVLFNNNVSPIHLVDIISPYVEENYEEEFLN